MQNQFPLPEIMQGNVQDRRARRLKALTEIAALIVGKAAPGWLVEVLDWGLDRLLISRMFASHAPTRAELRKALYQMREAAKLIRLNLFSPAVREVLGPSPPGALSNEGLQAELIQLLQRLSSADKALTSARGQTRKGRDRALAPNRLPPELVCAIFVTEAWRYVRGEAPARAGSEIAAIADKYWRLAGGATYDKSFEPLARWKSRFSEAVGGSSDLDRNGWIERRRTEFVGLLQEGASTSGSPSDESEIAG